MLRVRPRCVVFVISLGILSACPSPPAVESDETDETDRHTDTDLETDPPEPTPFLERAAAAGLVHPQYVQDDEPRSDCLGTGVHGGGAAVGDIDGDGLLDIFLAVYDAPSRLYLNRGDGTFEARIAPVPEGRPTGGALADIDGDGDLDLAVGHHGSGYLTLLVNDGSGTFTDETGVRGLGAPTAEHAICPLNWSLSFGDADMDGDLDLVVGSWDRDAGNSVATPSLLFRNDGTGHFVEDEDALRWTPFLYTFTPAFGDLDGDGRSDLAMTSDFGTNHWLRAGGDGPESLEPRTEGVDDVENGMGAVLVDIDQDDDLDWLVTAIFDDRVEDKGLWGRSGNRVYLNDGRGGFTDVSEAWGLRNGGWAWGIAAFDADNNGTLDIGWTNGHWMGRNARYLVEPFLVDPTALHLNEGTSAAPVWVDRAVELGIDFDGQGRGLVPFDLEGDGDLDVLEVVWNDVPRLYVNDTVAEGHHWLQVSVRAPAPNTHGIGATIVVEAEDGVFARRDIQANSTYLSQPPAVAHFGFGTRDAPLARVTVRWPYGEDVVLEDVAVDQHLVIRIPEAE